MAKKDIGIGELLKLVAIPIVIGLAAVFLGYAAAATLAAGLVLVAIPFTDFGKKNLKITKDWQKGVIALTGIVLLLGVSQVVDPFNSLLATITSMTGETAGGGGGQPASSFPTLTTVQQQGTSGIPGSTAQLTVVAKNLLNKTDDSLNPGGQYLKGTSYRSLSFTSGTATISNLDPRATIDKVSVGTDGTFYWTQKANVGLSADLSPQVDMAIVRVFTASDLTARNDDLNSITNGTTGNLTTGSGGTASGSLRFEVTSVYTGIRRPVFGWEVNTSAVSDVTMAGLQIVTCPSSLTTGAQERTLFRCYDSGFDWYVDSQSKTGIPNTQYSYKDNPFKIIYKTGINPSGTICNSANNGMGARVFVFDQDEDYRSSPGQTFFLDPQTSNTDLGSTNEPTIQICVD